MRWLFWLCALCLLACAHDVSRSSGRGAQAATASSASQAAEDGEVAPAYSSEPTSGRMLGDAVDDALAQGLANACSAAELTPDGRLSALASAVARATHGGAPSAALVSFHARRLGLMDPTPQLWVAQASTSSAVLGPLAAAVRGAVSLDKLSHCGGAAIRGADGVIVAVALSRRLVAFDTPIPRRVALGESLVLSGTLEAGYDQASLVITRPSGDVERIALARGRALRSRLRFEQKGEVTLEVLANGREGVTVVALLVLSVGVEPVLRAPRQESGAVERDGEAVAEALSGLIAGERKRRGLARLALHPGLSAVALAHSNDMLAHHFVAHTSPSSGEAQDRAARAGLRSVVLLENIGRGYSAAEIHAGLMESPGHRANILHPDVRSIGIGVGAEREGERQAFVVTELFARLAQPTDLANAQRDLFAAVNARRQRHKLSRLALDPALSRVAQAAADSFAANPSAGEESTLARASRSIKVLPRGASALSAALVQAEELGQVVESEPLRAKELVALGIGVAALPAGSQRQLAIVLLLAMRR